jgi:hypothetical protein
MFLHQAHPWLKEDEREQLCRIMDCQKLSLEACTHAAQNERLPLRVVVQVLFFEQLQLRTAIANCFMMSDTSSRPFRAAADGAPSGPLLSGAVRPVVGATGLDIESQQQQQQSLLRADIDSIRLRVQELERECSGIKQDMRSKPGKKLRSHWRLISAVMGGKFRAQLCRARGSEVQSQAPATAAAATAAPTRASRHDRSASIP